MPFPIKPPSPLKAGEFHFPTGHSFTLDNGIKTTVVENKSLPLVGIKLGIVSGLTPLEHEKPGITGIAAEMLSKGTARNSSEEIAEEIDFLGMEMRTTGGKDYTIVSAAVLSESIDKALDLIADIVINPTLPEDELAKTLNLEMASLVNKRTQPTYQAKKVYMRVLYGDHPYGAFDTDETVLQSITRNDLSQLHSEYFDPECTHLILTGDINPEKAKDLVYDKFSGWTGPSRTLEYSPQLSTSIRRRVCIVDNPNAVQSNIYIGNLAIPYSHHDYIPLLVTNQVLGGSFASRLFMNLREKRSFTYGAYSRINARVIGGILIANAAVRNEVTDDAIAEFLSEFRRIREEPVAQKELQAAVDYLTGSFPLELERSVDVANHIMVQKVHGLPDDYWDTFRERVREVTADQVIETAGKYIHPDQSMICVVGKADELAPVLSKYGTPELFDKTGNPIPQ